MKEKFGKKQDRVNQIFRKKKRHRKAERQNQKNRR